MVNEKERVKKKDKPEKKKLKCPYCIRTYSQDWTLENHIKVCAFKNRK